MSEYLIQGQTLTDIADAIRAKNGTATQYTPAEMLAAIQAISGGSEPEPPDDGKTRLYIHVPENAKEGLPPPRADVPLYIKQTVSNGVSIDWGDDSPTETISGTGNVNTTHHYNADGNYVIALTVAEGCELGLGWGSEDVCVLEQFNENHSNSGYRNMLQKTIIGRNVTDIDSYAFRFCTSLSSVVIPDGVTNISDGTFSGCYSLSSVVIPDGVTNISDGTFSGCYSLSSVVIPDGVTNIGGGAFSSCTSLSSVVIPDGVISIDMFAFNYCGSAKEYHILATTPPRIQSDTFQNIPSDCIIYVPAGTVDTYKTATNWAELADHIQKEPA